MNKLFALRDEMQLADGADRVPALAHGITHGDPFADNVLVHERLEGYRRSSILKIFASGRCCSICAAVQSDAVSERRRWRWRRRRQRRRRRRRRWTEGVEEPKKTLDYVRRFLIWNS